MTKTCLQSDLHSRQRKIYTNRYFGQSQQPKDAQYRNQIRIARERSISSRGLEIDGLTHLTRNRSLCGCPSTQGWGKLGGSPKRQPKHAESTRIPSISCKNRKWDLSFRSSFTRIKLEVLWEVNSYLRVFGALEFFFECRDKWWINLSLWLGW